MPTDKAGRCVVLIPEYHYKTFYTPLSRKRIEDLFPDLHYLHSDQVEKGAYSSRLREINPGIIVTGWGSHAIPEDHPVGPGALRYVCNTCGGIRNLVSRCLIERGLIVTDWGSSISPSVAEGALLLMLAANRRLTENYHQIRQLKKWEGAESQSLFGRTIGLHGFGRVARALVQLLIPFRVNLISYAPGVPWKVYSSYGVEPVDDLMTLFSESDIVVELEALTEQTKGVVREEHLRAIGTNGAFINIARAGLVDEEGLSRVAMEGDVHFGLDVFHTEPLPAGSPLRSLPNVTITPHSAGPTTDTYHLCGAHAVDNLERWVNGKSLDSIIDAKRYDLMT